MKAYKQLLFVLLFTFCLTFFLSCTNDNEPAPFFDGLYLKYDANRIQYLYHFKETENYQYTIVKTEQRKPLNDKTTEFHVDTYGKVSKSSNGKFEGKLSPVWIPVKKIEVGDHIDGKYKVLRNEQYKKWNVWVLKTIEFDVEHYFEIMTGYLVGVKGKFGMAFEYYLTSSNADIPEIE